MKRSPTFWLYIRDAPGREGHRDYFSRSFNALRNARNVSRIKSACVDTSSSTQSEPRPLAASCSSLSTPSNIFSYASSQTRPFSLLNPSTRSLVFLIRSAAASTSGVKFGVSGVTFGVAGVFAGALLAAGVFAARGVFARALLAAGVFAAALLAAGVFAGALLAAGVFAAAFLAGAFATASWLVSSPRPSWLVSSPRPSWLVSSPRPSWLLVSSPRPSCLVFQPFASPWLVSVVGTTLEGLAVQVLCLTHLPVRRAA